METQIKAVQINYDDVSRATFVLKKFNPQLPELVGLLQKPLTTIAITSPDLRCPATDGIRSHSTQRCNSRTNGLPGRRPMFIGPGLSSVLPLRASPISVYIIDV